MSLMRGEVTEVIERNEDYVIVKGKYWGPHAMFSPDGFECKITERLTEDIKEGYVWILMNHPNTEITFPDGEKLLIGDIGKQISNKLKNS